MITPVVLSGGSGTRLWPLSREHYPKQLLAVAGPGETMLQSTLLRLGSAVASGTPIVVCNEGHRFLVAEQLRSLPSAAGAQIILEPAGRNTAPAIALAARAALATGDAESDPLLLVLPADHVIADVEALHRAIEAALPLAAGGRFVTFGIVPQGPETGYGYIVQGSALEGGGAFEIARFVEKPARPAAESLIAAGG
jgi:mannose-1-phosphate guanylyltransferase/mannose-6-phosphate isomerase